MQAKNKFLIPKAEFTALIEDARKACATVEETHIKVWLELANQFNSHWDGRSVSFFDSYTPGQYALVCTANLHHYAKGNDFLGFVTLTPKIASMTFRAFEILKADEYLKLLKKVQEIFPNKQFPEYAEDIMSAIMKLPGDTSSYFGRFGIKFLAGKGMKRPLHEYVFAYIVAHPEDFCKV